MPSTVTGLLTAAGLECAGSVRWGTPVPAFYPGVYIVALDESPDACDAVLGRAPISEDRVAELLRARPELRLDTSRPTVTMLADRLASCWLPNETVCSTSGSPAQASDAVSASTTRLGSVREARTPAAGS